MDLSYCKELKKHFIYQLINKNLCKCTSTCTDPHKMDSADGKMESGTAQSISVTALQHESESAQNASVTALQHTRYSTSQNTMVCPCGPVCKGVWQGSFGVMPWIQIPCDRTFRIHDKGTFQVNIQYSYMYRHTTQTRPLPHMHTHTHTHTHTPGYLHSF